MTKGTLLFQFGAEGGGASVYRSTEGKILETGSSGGMLDEDEDPIRTWTKEFDTFENWWEGFKKEHKQFWPYLYPLFIHQDIKSFIKKEISEYKSDDEYSDLDFYSWKRALEKMD